MSLHRTPTQDRMVPREGVETREVQRSLLDLENEQDQVNEPENLGQETERHNSTAKSAPQEVMATWQGKLPSFMQEAPDIWFIVAEAEFVSSRVTKDQTKYLAVIRALDVGTLKQITDILKNPPEKNLYENLKTVILQRLLDSRVKQVDQLLKNLVLGDRKPSQLLREMKVLAKGEIGKEILHQLWLERLPAHIRPHLLTSNNMDLEAVAEMADRLVEAFSSSYVMATTSSKPHATSNEGLAKQLQDMQALLLTCMQEIKEIKGQGAQTESRPGSGRPHRSRSRTKSPARTKNLCYYHERFGKQAQKSADDSGITQVAHEKRLHLRDKKSGQRFLIDSGSMLSIVPVGNLKKALRRQDLTLYAANTTQIPTFGEQKLNLDLGLRRSFQWTFILADVPSAIIGADFLTHFNLLIDLKHGRLIDAITSLTSKGEILRSSLTNLSTINLSEPYAYLLSQYEEITKPTGRPTLKDMSFAHRIVTTGPPVFERSRKIFGERAAAAKAEINALLEAGTLRPSRSPWASPIHVAPKKDGTFRVCGDYRRLNAITVPDKYAPPLIQDLFPLLHGKTVFSSLDLTKAYHQIPMAEEDVQKTAITTPWGLYEYVAMPFGLKNATQSFQRYINHVFRELEFVFVYVDDILVMSENKTQHETHLKAVFKVLKDSNLSINPHKCKLGREDIDFLGFKISKQGYLPSTERVEKILEYPRPETVVELRRFIGMINYYRRSMRKAALIQAPLNEYLKSSRKNDRTPISWNAVSEEAFLLCKQRLAENTLLHFPSSGAKLRLTCDASTTMEFSNISATYRQGLF
ncbi:uncharacterized protein [Prorops nasuta]|uniref:uncharacterized protein n=1 Tax=Prorops nasuta TaxID=863751 RepID=UPI0034CD39FD